MAFADESERRRPGARKGVPYKGVLPRAYQLASGEWQAGRRVNGRRFRANGQSADEAAMALLEVIAKARNGEIVQRNKSLTIDKWLWEYHRLITTGDGAVAPTTADTYRHVIEKMLDPAYGLTGQKLTAITSDDIMAFRDKMGNVPTGKGARRAILGPSRRKAVEIRLNAALAAAAEAGKIPRNPWPKQLDKNTTRRRTKQAQRVKHERGEKEKIAERIDYYPQMIYYHLLGAFWGAFREWEKNQTPANQKRWEWAHTRLALYLLSFYGIRPAEARGITLDKVSIDEQTLSIHQQLQKHHPQSEGGQCGIYIRPETKTVAGQRTLPLSGPLLEVLARQVAIQEHAYQEGRRDTLDGRRLLLTTINGKPIRQTEHNNDWNFLLSQEQVGQSRLWRKPDPWDGKQWWPRLYANRHIAVTILQRAGFGYEEAITKLCGWDRSHRNQLDTYNHWDDEPSGDWSDDPQVQKAVATIGQTILGRSADYYTKPVTDRHGEPVIIDGTTITLAEAEALQADISEPPPDNEKLYRA